MGCYGISALSNMRVPVLMLLMLRESCGNSIGVNVGHCGAYDKAIWTAENKMDWCKAAKRSTDFSVRSGDGEAAEDPTTYSPGQLSYIHVRALKQYEKYRGMLLYAVNSAGDKVGTWELPAEQNQEFHTPRAPGRQGECPPTELGKAVMHKGALMKRYHNQFAFRAPAAGTGKITFHCLLKMGPANTGYFVWPNSKDLELTEKALTAQKIWYKGAPGESCHKVCRREKGACDAEKLAVGDTWPEVSPIKSTTSFNAALKKDFVCKGPLVSEGCGDRATTPSEGPDGYCAFQRPGCKQRPPHCWVASTGVSRFCPCTNITAVQINADVDRLGEDEWLEAVPSRTTDDWNEASTELTPKHAVSDCHVWTNQKDCKAQGCHFTEEQGMVICSKVPDPLAPA